MKIRLSLIQQYDSWKGSDPDVFAYLPEFIFSMAKKIRYQEAHDWIPEFISSIAQVQAKTNCKQHNITTKPGSTKQP